MLVVPIATEPTFQVGSPTVLFEAPYAHDRNSMGIPYYDVSSDGQRFLMVRTTVAEPATVTVGLNWFEELERLAPRR